VTGCPLAGVEHDELIDASPIAIAVDKRLNGNPAYGNLPRKFKITITGCQHWCSYPEINDIGATAVRRADGVVGFHVRVGGGLSTKPHLAVLLPAFVLPEQVPEVVETITAIFRDSDELRVNRAKARMKFLFVNHGWTAEKFLAEIERRLGYKLDALADEHPPEGHYRDHLGIQPQKQPGLSYAGILGRVGAHLPDQLRGLAAIADEFGDGSLRLSAMQNILITNVRNERAAELIERSRALGVALDGSPFQRGTASCTGSEYCKLAITETKLFSIRLAQELEERLPGLHGYGEAPRGRMPEFLRPASDRRRRTPGRAAQPGRHSGGRIRLLRRRGTRKEQHTRTSRGLPRSRGRSPRGARATLLDLRGAEAGRGECPVVDRPHRRCGGEGRPGRGGALVSTLAQPAAFARPTASERASCPVTASTR
jgi:dissimilatory sulfite reductase (desulfoviridin) alpha/beta subunit